MRRLLFYFLALVLVCTLMLGLCSCDEEGNIDLNIILNGNNLNDNQNTAGDGVENEPNDKQVHEHDFSEKEISDLYLKSPASCTESSVYYYSCKCGEVGIETFEYGKSLGHTWKNATCTDAETCSLCNITTGDPLGHSTTEYDSKEPTCTEFGWNAYETCSKCEYTTYSEIPANGHTFENNICSVCGQERVSEGLSYTLSDDGTYYTVTGIGTCTDTDIVIPDTYEGLPVKEIGNYAFRDCSSLTSVTIGNSVTSIGDFAFYCCSSLTSINIPDSVTSIGNYAFDFCYKLVEVINHSSLNITDGSFDNGWIAYHAIEVHTGESKIVNIDNYLFYTYKDVNYLLGYIGEDTELILPESYNGESYEIYERAFYNCSSLTSITIPNSVTSIGWAAFYYCSSLVSITIPDSVTSIGSSAFEGCSSLTSIAIPDSVTSIGSAAFYDCLSLKSIIVNENNENYKSIDGNLYTKDGKTLMRYAVGKTDTEFVIPDSVTSIGGSAFEGCSSLTSIIIPDGVTSIGYRAFSGCSSLASITIPNGVTNIGAYVFDGCYTLTSISIPDSVTSIGGWAFRGCSSLTSIIIPDGVTSIGSSAFEYCSSLTSITIPDSVTSIGGSAFEDCSSLTSINIPNSVTGIGDGAFWGCSSLTSITIGNGVTSIGERAFQWCYKLVEVINHSSLNITAGSYDNGYVACYAKEVHTGESKIVNIDNYLFYTYDSVNYLLGYIGEDTELVLPESYNGESYEIYERSFYNCSSLTSITIPDNVTSIGDNAFEYCYKLVEVINHSSLNITAGSPDNGCVAYYAKEVHTGESKIVTSDDYLFYVYDDGNYLFGYIGEDTELVLPESYNGESYEIYERSFYNCSSLTSITIPDNVTSIGDWAFEGCSSLVSITIPDSVTSIGEYAFRGCTNVIQVENGVSYVDRWVVYRDSSVETVVLRENTVGIADYAFFCCNRLTSITIPDSVTSIGGSAFVNCSSLTSVTIGNGVTSIGICAFEDCSSLTSITIPDSVTSIGYGAFRGCTNLIQVENGVSYADKWVVDCDTSVETVVLRENTVGIADYAFGRCSSLTSITIPDSVTSIGDWAFEGCSSLTSVTIPDSVTHVGSDAFAACEKLRNIYYTGSEEEWANIVFDSELKEGVTIHYNYEA